MSRSAVSLRGEQVRAAVLRAQGFDGSRPATPLGMVRRLGLIQVDSVNVLARAHYLPLFSRLGPYDRDALDRLAARPPRQLFEYWGHEASLIPVQTHPLLRWRMADGHAWSGPRRVAREQPQLVSDVLAAVAAGGPMTAAELERTVAGEHRRTQDYRWGWNWSDAKRALEYLFGCGEVSSAGRDRAFARRYDLTERVIPADVLRCPTPPRADSMRELITSAAAAMAVATESDLRDYWRLPAAAARAAIAELVADGTLQPVSVPDWPAAFKHRDAVTPRRASGRGLLAPFDPLIWHRPRTERIFGMRYRIEIYVPSHRRSFGYYVLPYLHDGHLVARLDLKADRAAGALLVRGSWSQPDGPPPDSYLRDLTDDLQAMAHWLGLRGVSTTGAVGDLSALLRGT